MIEFTVFGQPQGKARARSTKSGHHYTLRKTTEYENEIKLAYVQKYAKIKADTTKESLCLEINAYYEIPKSYSKKKVQRILEHEIKPTMKPDLDNIAKVVCDALNALAYKDDAQIVEMILKKYYSETPRIEITIQ